MGAFKRAVIYIIRSKWKSVLVFLVLFIIALSVILGASIKNGADIMSEDIKKSMGDSFCFSYSSFYEKSDPEEEKYYIYTILGEPQINEVMDHNGVVEYNAQKEFLMDTGINLYPVANEADDSLKGCTYFYAVNETLKHDYFVMDAFELVSGRHINRDDVNVAIISKDVADANGFKVGDSFAPSTNPAIRDKVDTAVTHKPLEIVGIYDINFNYDASVYNYEYELAENIIFSTVAAYDQWEQDIKDKNKKYRIYPTDYDYMTFFVESPERLDEIMQEARNTSWFLGWGEYGGRRNDSAYAGMTNPLDALSLSTAFIVAAIVACGILAIIIMLVKRSKTRGDESALLHTFGHSFMKVIGQRLWEVLLIAIIAVVAASALSFSFITPITEGIYKNAAEKEAIEERYSYEYYTPLSTRGISDAIITDNGILPDNIDFNIGFPEISAGAIVCLSTAASISFVVSAITINKQNRKERK